MSPIRFHSVLLAVSCAGAVLLALPGLASATYPGRPGALVYTDEVTSHAPGGDDTDNLILGEIPAGGGRSRQILNCDEVNGGGSAACPNIGVGFSPDGSRLVMGGNPDDNGNDSLLVGGLGGTFQQLSLPLANADHPEFMPDGKRIVFAGQPHQDFMPQLYLVASDGSGLRQLTQTGATNPAPCANGQIIYNDPAGRQLYVVSASGDRSRRLALGSLADCSRDSRTAVFIRHQTLYTIRLNATGQRKRSATDTVTGRPAFSPAGGEIDYLACTNRGCAGAAGSSDSCPSTSYVLTTISLTGRVLARRTLGSGGCDSDGFYDGDTFGQLAWQP
jgi:Tol biopolymer transport system component